MAIVAASERDAQSGWEGSDDWVRQQFEVYFLSFLSTAHHTFYGDHVMDASSSNVAIARPRGQSVTVTVQPGEEEIAPPLPARAGETESDSGMKIDSGIDADIDNTHADIDNTHSGIDNNDSGIVSVSDSTNIVDASLPSITVTTSSIPSSVTSSIPSTSTVASSTSITSTTSTTSTTTTTTANEPIVSLSDYGNKFIIGWRGTRNFAGWNALASTGRLLPSTVPGHPWHEDPLQTRLIQYEQCITVFFCVILCIFMSIYVSFCVIL